jgi:pyruvate carboxylase
MRAGAAEVYEHEMPGGQYTNLRQQARALGIESRWREVARAYADVNRMFGDIVKVTPTSKVVGDLAVYMVTNDLRPEQILDPEREIAFPDSVVEFFHGDLGQPYGGFPEALQRKVLKGVAPLSVRPGEALPDTDLKAAREEAEKKVRRSISDRELASYLMYPKVFLDFADHQRIHGDVSVVPTEAFFYGMRRDDELFVDIERGKTLIIRFLAVGDADLEGKRTIFFELNGQPREVKVADRSLAPSGAVKRTADEGDPSHVPAPMPGLVVSLSVRIGEKVAKGDRLLSIEAMKMETGVFADRAGAVGEILVKAGEQVDTKQLLMIIGEDGAEGPEEADEAPGDPAGGG